MPKKIIVAAMPLLLLFLTACPTNSETYVKNCDFRKTVEKKVATAGQAVKVTLSLTNRSRYDVEFYELDLEVDQKDFLVLGCNLHKGRNLKKWKTHEIVYQIIPLRSGKLKIGPSKIFRVKVEKEEKAFILPKKVGFSNSISLEVKPPMLEIRPYLKKTTVKLGENLELIAVIWNHGQTTIRGVNVTFEKDIPNLKPEFRREFIEIPPGGHKKARFLFKAIKSGNITPGRAVVFFGRQDRKGEKISSKRIFGISKKTLLKIQIKEVSLPGIEFPLRRYTKEISTYFSLFIPKILVIALLLILLVRIFTAALFSRLVENLFFRISLVFLIVWVTEALGIFLVCGGMWVFKTTPPDLWEIAMIITCSCGFVLFLEPTLFKNPFFNSFLVGVLLSLSAYFVFLGFMSFDLNEFINFPVREAVFFGLTGGIFLNAIFLRKELKRR